MKKNSSLSFIHPLVFVKSLFITKFPVNLHKIKIKKTTGVKQRKCILASGSLTVELKKCEQLNLKQSEDANRHWAESSSLHTDNVLYINTMESIKRVFLCFIFHFTRNLIYQSYYSIGWNLKLPFQTNAMKRWRRRKFSFIQYFKQTSQVKLK